MKHLLLCCALVIATTANAQSVKFGLQGNVADVSVYEPLNEVYGLGYGGGIHLDVKFLLFSFRLSGDYLTFAPDVNRYKNAAGKLLGASSAGLAVEGGRINVVSGNINGKMTVLPLPFISPYVTGGVGIVNVSFSEAKVSLNGRSVATVPAVKGETKPAVNFGVGADLDFGGLSLYAEVKYVVIFTKGGEIIQGVKVSEEGTIKYLPITVGITF
jgi:opacity protein-like surface antigen